jgi:hypothetical protein
VVNLTFDIKEKGFMSLVNSLEYIAQRELPNVYATVRRTALMIAKVWKDVALGQPLGSIRIKYPTGRYAKSITVKMVTPLKWIIFADPTIAPHASSLEYGTPEMDLKQIIPYGDKGRVTSKGTPYAIVPFRWNTPSANRPPGTKLPEELYAALLESIKSGGFKMSQVEKSYRVTPNFWGDSVRRRTYTWGDRLKDVGAGGNFDGMVAFNAASGTAERRTQFMTFRMVSAKPPGGDPSKSKAKKGWDRSWVVPAKQGLHITDAIVKSAAPVVREALAAAIRKDMGL